MTPDDSRVWAWVCGWLAVCCAATALVLWAG